MSETKSDASHRPTDRVVTGPDASTPDLQSRHVTGPVPIAIYLRQRATDFRQRAIAATIERQVIDVACCSAAAEVLEKIADKAEREGWTRTPPSAQ